ncbi:hypothetical protein HK100_012778 [Physocladia obscura]|uniref:Uncharacterized protein n=1 Tax=Physocladia obscura TaxID=109957 RepID=A0AAD5SZB3_9FUNG|nr:hypothetical protein HK100_012778 [Physocladia obscura]
MTEETSNKATTTISASDAALKATDLPFARGSLTSPMFFPLYSAFLHAFHADPPTSADAKQRPQCKITDHLLKFEHPPSFEGKSFNIFDFFRLIFSLGGFQYMKSWTDICRRIGMNPSKSNISTRIRDWAEKHHIVAYFDFLLGIPHDFYRPLRSDEIIGPKLVQKDGISVLESESEMWLRLYGLDGGESSRLKPVAPIIRSQTILQSGNNLSALKRDRDSHIHEDYYAEIMVARKRRHADSSDKIVIVGGVPMAALSIAEQKVLTEVHACIKAADTAGTSNRSLGSGGNGLGGHISTKKILVAGGELVVLSAENRLAALKNDLEKFKGLSWPQKILDNARNLQSLAGGNAEQGSAEVNFTEENANLKQDISQLMNLLKAQQNVLDNLRRRIIHIE